jgi:pimeloyl-ACP methyl ester carboxylesterase
VRRSALKLTALVAIASTCLIRAAVPAQATIAFARCGDSNNFACGHVTVALDPTGATPGTLTLALRRHRAPVGEAHSAIIALAGGPGQPALPFAEQFAELLGPIAATRDLIAFDQRGIGLSNPLSCHAFERSGRFRSLALAVESCAAQLGPTRSLYATAETVADIEAIRRAGGYDKLVLYGTSYGTKVAEEYAQSYPDHVEALVLDSVVAPNGPDPLSRATFAAVPLVLRQLCAASACAHVTRDPVADLARLVAHTRRGQLRGVAIDGQGTPHTISVSSDEMVELLLAGDLSPLLRAEALTAFAAGAGGDYAPLARLFSTVAGGTGGGGGEGPEFDTPLYFATTCEELDFPWSRASSPGARLAQATAAARAIAPSALAPFTAANALDLSELRACSRWPFTTPAPPLDTAPLPNVPALILSGSSDLRTPTANAREVAAAIPDAHLLVVSETGHSVLGTERDTCARDALLAMFAGKPLKPCRTTPLPPSLRPPPLPPVRLGLVSPTRGYGGLAGRTLHAISLTLADLGRQLVLQTAAGGSLEAVLLTSLRIGGLRAGWAELAGSALTFRGFAYVPGVTLSGAIRSERADLRIGGSSAAHGTLRLGPHDTLEGTLGGRHVGLPSSPGGTAAIVGVDAQVRPHSSPGGAAARAAARRLARLVAGFAQR